jgi:hypothetical protein
VAVLGFPEGEDFLVEIYVTFFQLPEFAKTKPRVQKDETSFGLCFVATHTHELDEFTLLLRRHETDSVFGLLEARKPSRHSLGRKTITRQSGLHHH